MTELLIFNGVLVAIIVGVLILLKRVCKTERSKNIAFLIVPLITILVHYSLFIVYNFTHHSVTDYLGSNPNLLLPIYPCNTVMWLALVYGVLINKTSKFARFLVDYLFWFGIVSTVVGMFANVDFIRNPTLTDFAVTKSVLAHATLLLNCLLFPVFGLVKIRLEKNLLHIVISVIAMFICGWYCNLLFASIVSPEYASQVNSMFLLHSPFPNIPFLKYPLISCIAIVGYFITFWICELFVYKKGERWNSRFKSALKNFK